MHGGRCIGLEPTLQPAGWALGLVKLGQLDMVLEHILNRTWASTALVHCALFRVHLVRFTLAPGLEHTARAIYGSA